MIKYLVTGAAGHLGLNIINELLKEKARIKVLVLPNDKNEKNLSSNVEICYGDVTKKNELKDFFKEDQDEHIVIHCAGIVSIASKFNDLVYNVNVNGTKNIVDMCLKHKVKKLIYVSSVHAIPEKPNNEIITEIRTFSDKNVHGLYAKTKAEATKYVLNATKKGLDAVVVHPSGIFGPYDYAKGHLTQLVIDFYNKKLKAAVNGGYDFVDVRDVAKGIISATKNGKKGECYILSNKYYEIKDILNILAEITNKKKINTYMPLSIAKAVAPLAEIYYKILKQPPLYTSYSLYTLESNANFSHKKASINLNYTTRDIKETLTDTVNFLKKEKIIN